MKREFTNAPEWKANKQLIIVKCEREGGKKKRDI